MHLILSSVLTTALLLSISGCGANVQVSSEACPQFYPIVEKEPKIRGQIKAFRIMSFVHDDTLSYATASCRFNNADGDNVMKNAVIIGQDDIIEVYTDWGEEHSEVMQHNNRCKNYGCGENNATE